MKLKNLHDDSFSKKRNVFWGDYNGIPYLEISFRELDDKEVIQLTLKIAKILYENKEQTRVCIDFSDLKISANVISVIRNFSKSHKKYIYKSGVIGISEMYMPFYNIYRKIVKTKSVLFESKKELLEHICSD